MLIYIYTFVDHSNTISVDEFSEMMIKSKLC